MLQEVAVLAELAVHRPKLVPPLDDAMRLVDREQRDRAARLPQGSHQRAEPLGRAVQQPNAPVERRIEDGASLGGGEQAVQIGRGDSAAPQPVGRTASTLWPASSGPSTRT